MFMWKRYSFFVLKKREFFFLNNYGSVWFKLTYKWRILFAKLPYDLYAMNVIIRIELTVGT